MLENYEEMKKSIQDSIVKIGKGILNANKLALEALENGNYDLLGEAKSGLKLKAVQKTTAGIDNEVVLSLARFAPEAVELRKMTAYLKITTELTRAATNTKNFIKLLSKHMDDEMSLDIVLQYTIPLLSSAIKAFENAIEIVSMDSEEEISLNFTKVTVEESKTDDLYEILEKSIFQLSVQQPELSHDYFQILGAVRRLEKVGDRSVSIANLLLFAALGGEIQ